MRNISQIIDSIKLNCDVSKDKEVAILLKMNGPALSNHKNRGSIPYEELASFCERKGLSLGWLLTGQGEMKVGEGGINGEQIAEPEGGYKAIKGPIGDVEKIQKKELFDQTLHDYLDLILIKGINTKRRDQIIRDIWYFGEELCTVSEKEGIIKQVLKKILTD